jgi:HemY protein
MELEAGEPDEARAFALEAHKLAPDLVPAALIASRLFVRAGDIRRASRILEATWKHAPHPDIADAYATVRSGDSAVDRLKRVRHLAALRANHVEGSLATARAAIDARDWRSARNALGGTLRANPTERVCLMMAEIEEGEHGDQGRVRAWLTRALNAQRDPAWVADGQTFDRWAPISPVTGRLDAFEWRVAGDRPARRAEIEVDEPMTAGEPEPIRPVAVPAPIVPRQEPPRSTAAMAPGVAAKGPRPMARAPDDPGPDDLDEEAESAGVEAFRSGRTA